MQKVAGSNPAGSIRLAGPNGPARSWQAVVLSKGAFVFGGTSESNVLSGATEGSEVEGHCAPDTSGVHMSATGQGFFVYILRCADGVYYVGLTTDVSARVDAHNAGQGPRFTACRRPVELVYSEPFDTMAQARQREIQIKKWSRAKKEALVAGDMQTLHNLSRRQSR